MNKDKIPTNTIKSDQILLKSKWMFLPKQKKFPQGAMEMLQ